MIAVALLATLTVAAASATPTARARRPFTEVDTAADDRPGARLAGRRRRPVLVVLGTIAISIVLHPIPAVGFVVSAAAWPRLRLLRADRLRQQRVEAAWPEAVEMLILVVRAGLTPHQSIVMLADLAPLPTRAGFAEVVRRVARGATLADAVGGLVHELGPGATNVADTLAMAERYGTPMTVAVEQLAVEVRDRRRRQAEARARQLPIRMSFPLVVCTLPSFVLVAIVPAVLASLSSLSDGHL